MPAEPEPITLSQVVNRAVDVVDPEGTHDGVAEVFARFEDADEPVTAVADPGERVAEAVGRLDPEEEDPELQLVWAVATYLAHRRDELEDDREALLRLAARSEWGGRPPDHVVDWLEAEGVTL
jgi:hypothetical protein